MVFLNLSVLVETTKILVVFQPKNSKILIFWVGIFSEIKFDKKKFLRKPRVQSSKLNECSFFWSWPQKKWKQSKFQHFRPWIRLILSNFRSFYSKFISTRIFGVMSISKTNFRVCNPPPVKMKKMISKSGYFEQNAYVRKDLNECSLWIALTFI